MVTTVADISEPAFVCQSSVSDLEPRILQPFGEMSDWLAASLFLVRRSESGLGQDFREGDLLRGLRSPPPKWPIFAEEPVMPNVNNLYSIDTRFRAALF